MHADQETTTHGDFYDGDIFNAANRHLIRLGLTDTDVMKVSGMPPTVLSADNKLAVKAFRG